MLTIEKKNKEQKPKIGEILLANGLIQHPQLVRALESQKHNPRKLGEVLVEMGFIEEVKLVEVLADIFRLPYIKLNDVVIDDAALQLVSSEYMQSNKVLPIALKDGVLTIAMRNPLDVSLLQELQIKCGCPIYPVMASTTEINEHLPKFVAHVQRIKEQAQENRIKEQSSPMVRLVNDLLEQAIAEKVSDIHLQPQKKHLRVRFRIDGILYDKTPIEKILERQVLSRFKVMAGMDVADNRKPQDGRAMVTFRGQNYDIRLSTIPDILGENLVMRILTKDYFNKDMSALGFDKVEIDLINKIVERPHGLILTTGPTGAGKTTTLYSMMERLNQPGRNIITVEDPVEYEMTGITQTAINDFIGYRFATAIRHILRHDPDIIMIGEIRDVETAEIAIRAALTGHLVLSTMHTNTAAGAITRLLEMDIEPFLISTAVSAVFAQRLARVLCPHCKEEYTPTPEVQKSLKAFYPDGTDLILAKPEGCVRCLNTGFAGRTGIYEILDVDDDFRSLILKRASEKEMIAAANKNGMNNLRASGIKKTIKQITSLEEIIRITAHE
ncbi:MAG: Flp pilus assembly complex ATPase component TadA [Candidatus Omnitrophica bacterium]|nr:Flp pilus assembly complex ATPase component TadA [Candidatus Omnitrophota bacterium]